MTVSIKCSLNTCSNPTKHDSGFCHHHRGMTSQLPTTPAVSVVSESHDPYMDMETGIMRNNFGATTQDQLDRLERRSSVAAMIDLQESKILGMYNLKHLAQFHKAIFGECYDWAGKYRTVNIDKPGTAFANAFAIEDYGREVFSDFSSDESFWDNIHDRDRFIQSLAHHFNQINGLHPFREGNGRATRAFLTQASESAGWRINWDSIGEQENIDASVAGQDDDLEPLVEMFDKCVSRD